MLPASRFLHFFALSILATSQQEQPNKPSLEDQQTIIQRAAEKATAYNANLPDFICTETLARSENRSKHGWKPRDTITVQLNYTGHKEDHKVLTQNGKSKNINFASLGGALSEGEFGGTLEDLFRPASAQFHWSEKQSVRGQNVDVFTYTIAKGKSGYAIQYSGGPRTVSNNIFVAYHGAVFIDPATGDTLRLTRIADLPGNFPVRTATTTIDYAFTTVGSRPYLLPASAQIELGTAALQTRNDVLFTNYRKFQSETNLSFPDEKQIK